MQRIWALTKGKERSKVLEHDQIVLLASELWQQYGKWTGRESMAGRPVKKPQQLSLAELLRAEMEGYPSAGGKEEAEVGNITKQFLSHDLATG